MKKLLHNMDGLFPATITPFTAEGQVNRDALLSLMRRNLREGARGFFFGGSSAECFLLRQEERLSLIETAAELKGEATLIAHVGALSTDMAVELGRKAKEVGFPILASTPPYYYGHRPEAVLQYYRDLLDATGLPVMLYNFPGNTGVHFDLSIPAYRELFRTEGIVGLKHTSLDLLHMERMLDLNPDLVVLNGYEQVLPGAVALGATGAVGATFNCYLPLWLRVFESARAGDAEESRILTARGNRLIQTMEKCGLVASIKYVLTRQGIDAGLPRRPFLPLTADQEREMDQVLEAEQMTP